MTAVLIALEDPERVKRWGGRVIAVRLVLLGVPVVLAEKTTNIADLRGCGLDR